VSICNVKICPGVYTQTPLKGGGEGSERQEERRGGKAGMKGEGGKRERGEGRGEGEEGNQSPHFLTKVMPLLQRRFHHVHAQ
jgi:hypothetical protein